MDSSSVFDWCWAVKAYVRGKILRQGAYRPQGNAFILPRLTTLKRLALLTRLWHLQPEKNDAVLNSLLQDPKQPIRLQAPASHQRQAFWKGDRRTGCLILART